MEERKFSEQELVRREKLQELVDKGIDPFGQRFDVTAYSKEIKETYGDKTHEELEEMAVEVKVAGRIMTKRRKGKVCFMHIQDRDGQIQLYVRMQSVKMFMKLSKKVIWRYRWCKRNRIYDKYRGMFY